MNYKTNKSLTTAMQQILTRAGASPQQHLLISNKSNTQLIWHIHNCAKYSFRVENLWFGHIHILFKFEHKQELHHSNVANYKTNRSSPQQHCELQKRAGDPPQQHCEMQNERELHHSNIANYKTCRSFTTATL